MSSYPVVNTAAMSVLSCDTQAAYQIIPTSQGARLGHGVTLALTHTSGPKLTGPGAQTTAQHTF